MIPRAMVVGAENNRTDNNGTGNNGAENNGQTGGAILPPTQPPA